MRITGIVVHKNVGDLYGAFYIPFNRQSRTADCQTLTEYLQTTSLELQTARLPRRHSLQTAMFEPQTEEFPSRLQTHSQILANPRLGDELTKSANNREQLKNFPVWSFGTMKNPDRTEMAH